MALANCSEFRFEGLCGFSRHVVEEEHIEPFDSIFALYGTFRNCLNMETFGCTLWEAASQTLDIGALLWLLSIYCVYCCDEGSQVSPRAAILLERARLLKSLTVWKFNSGKNKLVRES